LSRELIDGIEPFQLRYALLKKKRFTLPADIVIVTGLVAEIE
jgi:hypothetical protein